MSTMLKFVVYVQVLLFFSCFFKVLNGLTVSSSLSLSDRARFRRIFEEGLSVRDVKTISLAVEGLNTLSESILRPKETCEALKVACITGKDLDTVYYGCSGLRILGSNCDYSKSTKIVTEQVGRILEVSDSKDMESLSKIVYLRVSLNLPIDVTLLKAKMNSLMKGGALDQSYGNTIAASVFTDKTDLKRFWVEIEDTLQQADEVDGIHLLYDGGLITTARIVTSILILVDKYDEVASSLLKGEKIVKLSNFLISRRHTRDISAIVELVKALRALSSNKFTVPFVLSAVDNGVIERHTPRVLITITNVWGDKINNAEVIAETVKHIQTSVIVITRKHAINVLSSGVYELDLSSGKLDKGFYNIKIEIKANDTRYSAITATNLLVKVVSDIIVEQLEISVRERDQVSGAASLNYKVGMNKLLVDKLNINWHHRLDMKFIIKDDQEIVKPHQVFVKLTHDATFQEIIFVADTDKSDWYKFSLDLEKSNKDFDNLSGNYNIQLIVGDSVIKNPLQWIIASIKLEMPSSPSTDDVSDSRRSVAGMKKAPNPRIGKGPSIAKEQIFHVFRPADKRAGDFIAIIFTMLCTVPPLLIMIGLWGVIGMNVSNFEISLSSILFHSGLAVIFGLYYCYWSYLDMFTTLRYLIPIGAVTAFFGNRVLRQVASLRQKL